MALALTRRPTERIVIVHQGQTAVVTLVRVAGNKATLSFDAPGEFTIVRGELLERERTGAA